MSRIERNFLLLVLAVTSLLTFIGWLAFQKVTETVVETWGERLAENQIAYNSSRLMAPLEREIALVRQMVNSPTLIEWTHIPHDPLLQQAAMRELESFRNNFQAQNYFIALTKTLEYFHNNAENEYSGQELRYRLRPDRPADAWFFQLVDDGRDFHININPDVELGVTKLWIDLLMRDPDGQILAVAGTGLPLDDILSELIISENEGVTGVFVDINGAIQLYQDRRLIDFASFVQPEGQKRTLDLIVDLPADGERLLETLARARSEPDTQQIFTDFVTKGGRRHLVAIAYLPSVGWFDVTFLDLSQIFSRQQFWPLAFLLFVVFLATLSIIHLALRREILRPLNQLIKEIEFIGGIKKGNSKRPNRIYPGELKLVFEKFNTMVEQIQEHTNELEKQVAQRTQELEVRARSDSLTGLLNRAGMTEMIETEASRYERTKQCYGIIWIDIDGFKKVNDAYGHSAGDTILVTLADILRATLRPYDQAARWGGDEFLILLSPCTQEQLDLISNRIRENISKNAVFLQHSMTVSTGAALVDDNETPKTLIIRADQALYRSKREGGNQSHMN